MTTSVCIPDPDLLAIEAWLVENAIVPACFEVVDVSDLTLYYDVILNVTFSDARDAMLFKLTWVSR